MPTDFSRVEEASYIISAIDMTKGAIDSAKAGVKSLQASIKDFELKSKTQFDNMKKHWMAWSMGVASAAMAIQKAFELADMAAQFNEQKAGLNALAAQYNYTADAVINMTKEAVNGQLSIVEASQLASRALVLGFDPGRVAKFVEVSERLTDVVGGQIPDAFEAMERAAATGRSRMLVQYGIVIDLNKILEKYAKAHGIAKEAISDKMAVQIRANAILEEARRITDKLGESELSTADKINIIKATIKDVELWLGQASIRAGLLAAGAFQTLASAALTLYSALMRINQAYLLATGQTDKAADAARDAEAAWQASVDLAGKAQRNFSAMIAEETALAKAMTRVSRDTGDSLDSVSSKAKKATKDVADLYRAAYPFTEKAAGTYFEGTTGGTREILPGYIDTYFPKKRQESAYEVLNRFVNSIGGAGKEFKFTVDEAGSGLATEQRLSGFNFSSLIGKAGSAFSLGTIAAGANVAMMWAQLVIAIAGLIKEIAELGAKVTNAVADMTDAIAVMADNWGKAIDRSVESLTRMLEEGIPKIFTQLIPKIIEAWPRVIKAIQDGIPTIIKSVVDSIPTITAAITRSIPDIIQAFIAGVPDIVKALIESISNIGPSKAAEGIAGGFGVDSGGQNFIGSFMKATNPIEFVGDLFGGLFHQGGIIGEMAQQRRVPAFAFAGAPRAHRGLSLDEVPIIAQRGERVLSRRERADYERGRGDTYVFNNSGVVTTDDVDSWFSGRIKNHQRFRRGVTLSEKSLTAAGLA